MTRHAKASSTQPAVSLGIRQGGHFVVASFVLIVAVLALGASSALAGEVHKFSKSFGAGELSLGSQSNLAINQESGEVYVADTGNSRIAKFTAAGVADGTLATITEPTFIAVDNSGGSSKGDVYVVNAADNSITKLDALGLPVSGWGTAGSLGGLGAIAGIAVDSSGDLWAYNTEAIMRKLSGSTGAQLTEWSLPYGVSTRGIAVDSHINLYVVRGSTEVTQLTSAGKELVFALGGGVTAASLAVDESNDDVYLGTETSVVRVNSSNKIVETFGQGGPEVHYASGTSVRAATGDVYVANAETDDISVFSFENVDPPTITIEAPDAVTARTAHFSGHINPNAPGGNPSIYDVIWKFECGALSCSGVEGQISADSSNHLVDGTVTGLQPHTHYEVILTAKNAGNTVKTAPQGFTTLADEPLAVNGFVGSVSDTEATLNAIVTPFGAPTTYHFDYVSKAAYEAEGGFASSQTRSTPEEGLPQVDNNGHLISTRVTGLEPHTAYVYRVVATNSVGSSAWPTEVEEGEGLVPPFTTLGEAPAPETDCPNQAFREFAGAALPDCRAYEQASPADKNGLNIEGFQDLLTASPDGSKVTYFSQAGSGIPAGGGAHQELTTLLSSRQGESWSAQRLLPPEELGEKAGFIGASPDQRYALVETFQRGTAGQNGLFIIDTSDFSTAQIAPAVRHPGLNSGLGQYGYDSISADGSRVFFETEYQLTPNAAAERDNLYMWSRASGEISLVGVLPGASEEAPSRGSFGGAYDWFFGGTARGGSLRGLGVEALHAVSPDGDQAYFTAGGTGQLYLRRGLTGSAPTTVKVSEANEGVVDPWIEEIGEELPAAFQEATPDGSRAFFLSGQKLTEDATTGEYDEGKDLYRYDAKTGTLVDITPDPSESESNGARVQGLLGASADGSSGYFTARGVLAAGGEAGKINIYRFAEEGGNFTLTFVARLSDDSSPEFVLGDATNWSPQSWNGGKISPSSSHAKTSRVTPDGQTLLFASLRSLTGFDNNGCAGGGPCREVYLYSAGDESLDCISCNPSGEKAVGDAQIATDTLNGYFLPNTFNEATLTRSISADGSRVFFQTGDSLVAADTNGAAGCKFSIERERGSLSEAFGIPACQDVYEWEAPGAPGGSCHKAEVNGGCLYLLSSGKSKEASYFIDASSDGSTAFIATSSQLVPTDKDELYDAYAVRTNGGLASQHVTATIPCSSGEACHGSSSQAPETSSPGTSSFQGPGNPKSGKTKAKKCKKNAHKSCKKKQKKKHQKKKNAKRPNVTTRKAGGSK